jgi:hypothetical protein
MLGYLKEFPTPTEGAMKVAKKKVVTGIAGLLIGSGAVVSAYGAPVKFAQEQVVVYLENVCSTAAYPNDQSEDHQWKIKKLVDGSDVVGYVVEDGSSRCLISMDSDGFMSGMQIHRTAAQEVADDDDGPTVQPKPTKKVKPEKKVVKLSNSDDDN